MRPPRRAFAKARRYAHGAMNQTETAYAQVLEARKRAGHVIDYWYECVSLEVGPNARWYPDFVVQMPDGEIQLHEVKRRRKTNDGSSSWFAEDDAKVKIKAARARYPFRIFVVWPESAKTLHFHSEEIAP